MKFILTLSLLFASNILYAQKTYPVGGKLKYAESKEPVVGATIFILTADSSIAAGAVSNGNGEFTVDLDRGEYIIKINYLGLQPYSEPLRVWRDDYLGTILLDRKSVGKGCSVVLGVVRMSQT